VEDGFLGLLIWKSFFNFIQEYRSAEAVFQASGDGVGAD
jgi:hypothetical protein